MLFRKIFFLLLSAIVCYVSRAQQPQGSISGQVTDEHGAPLENVTVVLLQASDSAYLEGVVTGIDGRFILSRLTPRPYLLSFSILGFKSPVSPRPGSAMNSCRSIRLSTPGTGHR